MRLFIDECLSPKFALDLVELGHDAIHPLHVGRRGQLDHTVKETCFAEDRVIVTENVGDFKALLGREPIHPGLIALPQTSRAHGWALIAAALSFLETRGCPMDAMVNHYLDFDAQGRPALHALSSSVDCKRRLFPILLMGLSTVEDLRFSALLRQIERSRGNGTIERDARGDRRCRQACKTHSFREPGMA